MEQTVRSYSPHVSPEATPLVGSLEMSFPSIQVTNATEIPVAQNSQSAGPSEPVPSDIQAVLQRSTEEHSSVYRAHNAAENTLSAASGSLIPHQADPGGSPLLKDSTTISTLPGMSTHTEALPPASDQGRLPSSPRSERDDIQVVTKDDAESKRPSEIAPMEQVEPLAAYTCPICFSPPSYATITPCGHVLCGECLFTAVKTTIQRGAYTLPPGERMTARYALTSVPLSGSTMTKATI